MVVAHHTIPKFQAEPESGVKIDLGPPWNNVGPVGTSNKLGPEALQLLTLQVLPKAARVSTITNVQRAAAGSPRRARRARPLASQAPDRARSSASLTTKKARAVRV